MVAAYVACVLIGATLLASRGPRVMLFRPLPQAAPAQAPAPVESPRPRLGVVRADGRNLLDDSGYFSPLGATYFTAIHWFKFDRPRFDAEMQWLEAHQVDSIRIFSSIGFDGAEVDPRWPDYDDVFRSFLDAVYKDYGMRVDLSVTGGMDTWWNGSEDAFAAHFERMVRLIQGRQHQVQSLTAVNEAFHTLGNIQLLERVTRIIAKAGVPLVAASDRLNILASDDAGEQAQAAASAKWGATLAVVHLDRSPRDEGWAAATVPPWPWRMFRMPIHNEEPIGPTSSVYWNADPVINATHRAVSILSGMSGYVFHTAAGVDSIAHGGDAGHAPNAANIRDEPNADAVLVALRRLDRYLPPKPSDGRYEELKIPGVYRAYLSVQDPGWWAVLARVTETVGFVQGQPFEVEVFDILKGKVGETRTIQAGEPLRIEPGSGTTILRGRYLK
jgi:hypothetical protein